VDKFIQHLVSLVLVILVILFVVILVFFIVPVIVVFFIVPVIVVILFVVIRVVFLICIYISIVFNLDWQALLASKRTNVFAQEKKTKALAHVEQDVIRA
jgi:hypothetical protein